LGMEPGPSPEQSGRQNPCVVENNQVVCSQDFRKLAKPLVPTLPGAPVQVQHPTCRPVCKWLLGNQFFRKVEIKVGNEHDSL
jgi:hypothetical protein